MFFFKSDFFKRYLSLSLYKYTSYTYYIIMKTVFLHDFLYYIYN